MATTGPFHSLTDTNKHELTELISSGRSVRSAAGQLDLNYSHALNFAHHINHDTSRKPCNQDDLARAVAAVAAGATLTAAAKAHQVPISAVCNQATLTGVHNPRSLPRGAGATDRRINYLLLRLNAMGQADAAKACGIHLHAAQDFDRGVIKSPRGRRRFIAHGPQAGTYNRLMKTLRTTAHIIDVTSGLDIVDIAAVDPTRPIDARYLSLMERERIRDLLAAGYNYSQIGKALGRHRSTISREVRRNTGADGQYFPTTAARWAAARRLRPKDAKIASDQMLAKIIQDRLSLAWSPEQIAGWLRWQYPETSEVACVS